MSLDFSSNLNVKEALGLVEYHVGIKYSMHEVNVHQLLCLKISVNHTNIS